MRLVRLQLQDFRSYRQLDLSLDDPWVLLVGANAQGKTNLLEAVTVACAGYSPRAASDADMVRWGQDRARVSAWVATEARGTLELQVTLAAVGRRQVEINGAARRQADLVGTVGVVPFSVDDLDVVKGDPAARRRFLDLELGALNRAYYWNLARYRRALEQRNRLLKEIRGRARAPGELDAWSEQLTRSAAVLVEKRAGFLRALAAHGSRAYRSLTGGDDALELRYAPALDDPGATRSDDRRGGSLGLGVWSRIESAGQDPVELRRLVAERLQRALAQGRAQEIERGMTLCGPHRDDFGIIGGGVDLHRFGSQGEQRSAAVALRLGLLQVVAESVGEPPLLLLDDVLSELDHERRAGLFEALGAAGQTIITASDVDVIPDGVRAAARMLKVVRGTVRAA
jgi:DNA replication and repair protein RecF